MDFIIERNEAKMEEALERCGSYVLKTDQTVDAITLWKLYMSLLKAESGFRMLKAPSDFAQTTTNWKTALTVIYSSAFSPITFSTGFAQSLNNREWSTIRRILRTHSLVSTRLPLEDGRIITIRNPRNPAAEQSRIYTELGIDRRKAYTSVRSEVKM